MQTRSLEPGADQFNQGRMKGIEGGKLDALNSIAISLKRIADVIEAANQPKIDYSSLKAR